MGLENVKLMYAFLPGGKSVTIPLVREGAYDTDDIRARLEKAGVTEAELPYVVFSPTPHVGEIESLVAVDGVTKAPPDSQPKIPIPKTAETPPPLFSELGPLTSVTVTPQWKQETGRTYSMRRADNQGFVAVQNLNKNAFANPDDYDKINDGRIKLCFGLIWRRQALNFIKVGSRWDQRVETTHGMSRTDSLSISASVGYSGGGASASISATYGFSITVSAETKVSNEISVDGQTGESITAALWELCRKYVVQVDGVVRDESNPFTIVFVDKGGRHELQDAWSPRYEVISETATLQTTPFPI